MNINSNVALFLNVKFENFFNFKDIKNSIVFSIIMRSISQLNEEKKLITKSLA